MGRACSAIQVRWGKQQNWCVQANAVFGIDFSTWVKVKGEKERASNVAWRSSLPSRPLYGHRCSADAPGRISAIWLTPRRRFILMQFSFWPIKPAKAGKLSQPGDVRLFRNLSYGNLKCRPLVSLILKHLQLFRLSRDWQVKRSAVAQSIRGLNQSVYWWDICELFGDDLNFYHGLLGLLISLQFITSIQLYIHHLTGPKTEKD
jgi:hypothetical protein